MWERLGSRLKTARRRGLEQRLHNLFSFLGISRTSSLRLGHNLAGTGSWTVRGKAEEKIECGHQLVQSQCTVRFAGWLESSQIAPLNSENAAEYFHSFLNQWKYPQDWTAGRGKLCKQSYSLRDRTVPLSSYDDRVRLRGTALGRMCPSCSRSL